MRSCTLIVFAVLLAGCPGGDGAIGATCGSHDDCDKALQCAAGVCVPRCARGPDCGDGYACDADGLCQRATGQPGDRCTAEVQCAAGLACTIDNATAMDANGYLLASCSVQKSGAPSGAACVVDDDCRNDTCALGHCVDLCSETRDCGGGNAWMDIPRVEAGGARFAGCLPAQGNIIWSIPVSAPTANVVLLPVPSAAKSATVVFSVDDPAQRVGAASLYGPDGRALYVPCTGTGCDPIADYYSHIVRHEPLSGQSTLEMPSTPDVPFQSGAYRLTVSSYRQNNTPGSAIPHVTAIVRIDSAVLLDLHFNFLNLEGHMCEGAYGNARLTADAAQQGAFFQDDFLGEIQSIFAHAGIALGNVTYRDILDRPDLDLLDSETNGGDMLELGDSPTGVNVFFVRALAPAGLLAFGPNPGPAGLANTRQSGIVIGVDTLCYRTWRQLARITAHELARYMGLFHNVELGSDPNMTFRDNIEDTDDSVSNLMFYSEFGGTDITPGQRDILTRSAVLR
jgi:hypothetical protein